MLKNYKNYIRRKRTITKRQSFRDRIHDKIARITKTNQCYIVEPSKEPNGLKEYVVIYESESKNGYNIGRVYKGTQKQCDKLCKELNNVIKERRVINEQN